MKKIFYCILILISVFSETLNGQCSFTTNITASGSTLSCGNITLTTGATGTSYAWSNGATVQAITASVTGNYSVLIINASGCTATAVQAVSVVPIPTLVVSGSSLNCAGSTSTMNVVGASSYTWSPNAGSSNSYSVTVNPTTTAIFSVTGSNGVCTATNAILLNVNPNPSVGILSSSPTTTCTALTLSANAIGNTWIQKAGANTARDLTASFTIGNKGYIGTGWNGNYLNDLWEYDPSNNAWTQKANFAGTARYSAVGLSIGNKGYIGTGYNGNYLVDFWEYDPNSNAWAQKANFGGSGRSYAAGFGTLSKGYIGTGWNGSNLGDFWEFDPNVNSWTQKANFAGGARRGAIGFTIFNKGYITTGYGTAVMSDLWEYDSGSNQWNQKASLPSTAGRFYGTGASAGLKAYVGCGSSASSTNTNDFWEYDLLTNTWTQRANFGGAVRYVPTCFSINDKIYMGLGYLSTTSSFYSDIWEYTPPSNFLWSNGSSSSSITVSFSGTYSLTTTNIYGCSSTSSQTVNITSPTTINIAGPSNVCSGSSVTLTVSGANNYTWGANASNATTSMVTLSPSINTVYSVIGSNGACPATASVAINVYASPNVTANASSLNVCMGSTLNLFGTGAITYSWSNSVINNTIFTPTLTNSYTVIGVNANLCTNSAVVTVSISSLPTLAVNSGTICQGQTFTLIPTGAVSYTYSSGSNLVSPIITNIYTITGSNALGCLAAAGVTSTLSVLPSPTISVLGGSICAGNSFTLTPIGAITFSYSGGSSIVSPSVTTSYSVFGTSLNGCSNVNPVLVTITVMPIPVITAPSGSICSGSTFIINPSGALSYTYSSGTNVVAPTFNAFYSVMGTSNAGCVSTAPAVVFVTVNPVPIISVNSATICQGQTFVMTPTGGISYTYSSVSPSVSPLSNSSYSVTGSNVFGCASSMAAISNVNVLISPTVVVSGGSICSGQSFTLAPSGAVGYTYSGGSSVVSPTSNASYTTIGVAANGCVNMNLAVANITVNQLPIITAPSGSICAGGIFTIVPSGASSYTYSSGTNTVSPLLNSFFTVSGTSSAGCLSNSPVIVTVTVNPNPTLSVSSGTICQGQSFNINPLGASNYTIGGGSSIVSPITTSSYTVSGSSAFGCLAVSSVISNVSVLASPTLAVSGGSICAGQSFTLQPSGANSYTFSGGSAVVSPSVNTTYTILGSLLNGCLNANLSVATITVSALPNIALSSGTVCAGNSFTLNPSGAANYTYSSGTNIVTPAITTTYSVLGSNSVGCVNPIPATVTITPIALPVISVNSGTICQGQSFSIIAIGANSYIYSSGGSIVSPTISSTYSITGMGLSGCTSSIAAISSVNVLVSPAITVNSGSICAGQTFAILPSGALTYTVSGGNLNVSPITNTNFTVSGTGANGCMNNNLAVSNVSVVALPTVSAVSGSICSGNAYTINPIGASTYTYSSGSQVVSPTSNTTYSVLGSNAAGCVSSNSAVVNVSVNALPIISVNNATICQGKSYTINPTGASTYTYSGGSSVVSPLNTSSYSVTGTSLFGCISNSPAVQLVSVIATPTLSVNSGSICSGQLFTIIPSGAATYTYSGGSATVSPTSNSNYTVTGTSVNGCTNNNLTVASVSVISLPSVSVSDGVICAGNAFTITPSGALNYTYSGGSAIVSPTANSTYSIYGANASGCAAASPAVSNVSVNTNPTISVNNGTICNGQNFAIFPTGANTYTISGGTFTVSPLSSSNYTIVGTSSFGCLSSPAIASVSVLSLPSITVNSGSICAGQSFTMTPTGAISYTYNGGGPVVSPASSTNYSVLGTGANGCLSNLAAVSNVTVKLLPIISVSSGSICAGSSFTINPTSSGGGAVSYTYSSGSQIVSPTVNATYSVSATSSAGCVSATASILNVTVNALPVLTVNSSSICLGQAFTITPNGASTYSYSSSSSIVSPSVTSSYSVLGTSAAGCTSSIQSVSNVTVVPLPIVTASGGTICAGNSFTILPNGANNYTVSGGTTIVNPTTSATYSVLGSSTLGCVSSSPALVNIIVNQTPLITVANGSVCFGNSYTINPSGANSYTYSSGNNIITPTISASYTVIGSFTNGCVSNSASVIQVSVLPNPTISLPTNVIICSGNTYTISPSGAANYSFSPGNGVVNPTITSSYSVIGASVQGCTNIAVMSLSVQPSLSLTIIGLNVACAGQSLVLSASGANSYTWSNGVTSNSIAINPTATSVYTVIADSLYCSGSMTKTVNINALPNLSVQSTQSVMCTNEFAILTCGGANNYTWSTGSTNNTITVSPTVTMTYSVIGQDNNGCINSKAFTQSVDACVGIKMIPNSIELYIQLFPNPSNGKFIIKSERELINAKIVITDNLGRNIYYEKLIESSGEIDLTSATNGIYFVKVYSENLLLATFKLIKEQ